MSGLIKLEWRDDDEPRLRCACCGGDVGLYETETKTGKFLKAVNCETADLLFDDDGEDTGVQCPMYLPGMYFEAPTRREAIDIWNRVQQRLIDLRRSAGGQEQAS